MIKIDEERLWKILFNEACVEGQQAERIYNELKEIDSDRWIPVEDRLPEPNTSVLCCFNNGEIDLMWQDWERKQKNGLIYGDFEGNTIKVIAWCPLPEPYCPERREGHDGK